MDLSQVLEFLRGQENGEAMIAAVNGKVSSLNSEAASWRTKLRETEGELNRLNELSGGDSKALEGKLTGLTQQLEATKSDLEAAKLAQAEAIAKETGLRKSLLLQEAAVKIGADGTALKELLGNIELEKIAISDQDVTVDGKPLTDFAAEKGEWATRALFPSNSKPALPTGGTAGQAPVDPVKSYLEKTYTRSKKVNGAS